MTRKQSKQKAKEKAQALAAERVAGREEGTGTGRDPLMTTPGPHTSDQDRAIAWLIQLSSNKGMMNLLRVALVSSLNTDLGKSQSKHRTHAFAIWLKVDLSASHPLGAFSITHTGIYPHSEVAATLAARVGADEVPVIPPYNEEHARLLLYVHSPSFAVLRTLQIPHSDKKPLVPTPSFGPDRDELTAIWMEDFKEMTEAYREPALQRLHDDRRKCGKEGHTSKCSSCGKGIGKGKATICGGCIVARYCSETCKREHWASGHRVCCEPTTTTVDGLDSRALSEPSLVATQRAFPIFSRLLKPDVITACCSAYKLLHGKTQDLQGTHFLVIAVSPIEGSDPSVQFVVDFARMYTPTEFLCYHMDQALPSGDTLDNINNISKILGLLPQIEAFLKIDLETKVDFDVFRCTAVFLDLQVGVSYLTSYNVPSVALVSEPETLLRRYGARTTDDQWEERLKQRAKISAVEVQPGAKPAMSKREWARWTEEL